MDDTCTYRIELQGQLDEQDLTHASPLSITLLKSCPDSTLISVRTDQPGLIGLLRHLHGRGLVLLSVRCER
jgi:hypothetical protein